MQDSHAGAADGLEQDATTGEPQPRLTPEERGAQRERKAAERAERQAARAARQAERAARQAARESERAEREKRRQEKARRLPDDFDPQAQEIIQAVRPWTMTSPDKLFALVESVRHLVRTGVEGDLVECGVWRGGSMHAVARVLLAEGVTDRELHLFDTFEGMTEPTEHDRTLGGAAAADLLAAADRDAQVWAVASLDDVREGLATLDYPQERFHLVPGPVEETVPGQAPQRIALLRLDTDWYASTKHELEHLYDRLEPGGVLIIDDYGSWQGSKEATDEFLAALAPAARPLMLRAGRARVGVKPGR